MDAGLRVGVALGADRLLWPLAGTGVGGGALTSHRQSALVANPAIGTDALEALEIHGDLTTQIAFDYIAVLLQRVYDLGELILVEVASPGGRFNFGLLQDFGRDFRADARDITERDDDALLAGDVDAEYTCHGNQPCRCL
eukprot:TRINITY_DN38158_c0_g1_i2.p2 TRINITY_DN38158_c0_g1~~TRINITY_DN38158_c0_g1_i2.p2  ORF type:complete len:140 (+),score=17.05 TRINITY_DN38158_c0_g1_i2:264-683(+)